MDRKVNDFASCVGFYRRHGSLSGFFQGGSAILNGSGAWVGRPALAGIRLFLTATFLGSRIRCGTEFFRDRIRCKIDFLFDSVLICFRLYKNEP